jgi:hypothetical protein
LWLAGWALLLLLLLCLAHLLLLMQLTQIQQQQQQRQQQKRCKEGYPLLMQVLPAWHSSSSSSLPGLP